MRFTKTGWIAALLASLWIIAGVGFVTAALVWGTPSSLLDVAPGLVLVVVFITPGVGASGLVAWASSTLTDSERAKKIALLAMVLSLVSLFLVWVTIIVGGILFAPLALATVALTVGNLFFRKSRYTVARSR